MSKAWMPLYVGDYLGDTTHLNQGQHGAYLLLIMHYWQRGSLPIDRDECYCIARAMDKQSRCNADKVIKQFFVQKGGALSHLRIDAELVKSEESYKRRAGAAHARWGGRKQMQSNSNGDALHQQSHPLKAITPPTPLSGGLTKREFKKVLEELQRIGKMSQGSEIDDRAALEKACLRVGVEFTRAKYMLENEATA